MKIVAVADLHGHFYDIPECDVLIIAGDICPDYPFYRTFGDPDLMRAEQMHWLASDYHAWEQKIPAKRILATTGNHDWICRFPEHCRSEMFIDDGVEIDGKTFWFTPWIPPIGNWNYMLPRGARKERFAEIPQRLDVLVSHCPPFNTLDKNFSGEHIGCQELRAAIYKKKPGHVFFGHCHEGRREGLDMVLGDSQLHHVSVYRQSHVRCWDIA